MPTLPKGRCAWTCVLRLLLASLTIVTIIPSSTVGQATNLNMWVDTNFDGLPGPDKGNLMQLSDRDSVDIYVNSRDFAWTNFLCFFALGDTGAPEYFSTDTADVSAQLGISGGSPFPEDNFSRPNTIGLGGIGFPEQTGVLRLARLALRPQLVSPWNAATIIPIVDPNDPWGAVTILGNGTAYGVFQDGCVVGARLTMTPANDAFPSGVVVRPESAMIGLLGSRPFTAAMRYWDGFEVDATTVVAWSSSNPNVATVDSFGVARARSAGTTTIRADAHPYADSAMLVVDEAVSIEAAPDAVVLGARDLVVYPNPARNGETTILFRVPQSREIGESGSRAAAAIYDLSGRRIRLLVDGVFLAGDARARWDGRGEDGSPVGAGVYVLRAQGGSGAAQSSRIVVLR